jgi:glutamyl-tRNA reductase
MSPAVASPRLTVIGANHRSASLGLRDQLFIDDAASADFLVDLKRRGLHEALVLSTCDRVEVWASHVDADAVHGQVAESLAVRTGMPVAALTGQLYRHDGPDAVRHCFAVTASLDSLIIGEPHVLGQVKAAHRLARDAATCGPELEAVLQAAFNAAKRIRSETRIGEGPVSIAAAAVQIARDLHGDLSRCTALLVGAADMGELVAESLQAAGIGRLLVTAPRASRAEALAVTLNANVVGFDALRDMLADADLVVCSVGTRAITITAEMMNAALKKRRRKPVFVVDAGIPGDVEPAVNRVDGAFLYDLADLEKVALEGRSAREQAARAAWAMLEDEVGGFLRGRAARVAVPAIISLRQRCDEIRDGVLAENPANADDATRLLLNRLLHAPTEVMKSVAADGPEWQAMEKTLRKLFRLD